jgi:hypothetical protein
MDVLIFSIMTSMVLPTLKRLFITASLGLAILMLSLNPWTTPFANADAIAPSSTLTAQASDDLDGDRLQVIKDCLPQQLTIQNKDTVDRIVRAFDELGNEQLERMFNLTDNPDLNDAEVEFEKCLKRNGYTPRRQQVSE